MSTDSELLNLEEFQEQILSQAKQTLISEGMVNPATFIVARKMGISPKVRSLLRKLTSLEKMDDDEAASNPNDLVCMILPNVMNPSIILEIIPDALEGVQFEKGKFEPSLIEVLRASASGFFQTTDSTIIDEKVWGALRRILDMTEKDVFSFYLKYLCRSAEAEAILKVDEVFFQMKPVLEGKNPEDVDVPQNLGDDPTSEEGVMCSLETKSVQKMAILKFKRDADKKPTSFERVNMGGQKTEHKNVMNGRFMNLIKPETTSESSA